MTDKRQADASEQRDRIETYLRRSGLGPRSPGVVPLTGDASDRRYYRVLMADEPSIVLSLYATAFDFDRLPFVNVARLLQRMPVPIPTVLGHVDEIGVLAQEDLGDVTLQAHLGAATPAEHAALYRQAVALIATLQRRGAELESPEYLPYGIAFDVEKLTWELDFFIKHFVEAYRGAVIAPADRDELRREFAVLIEQLAAEPRVLCHRGYTDATAAELKAAFPRFAAVSDATVDFYLERARRQVDTNWTEGDYAYAQMLYACHTMTLAGLGTGAESESAANGTGEFKTIRSGSLTLERFDRDGNGDAQGELGSTSYGRQFANLRRQNRGGARITPSGTLPVGALGCRYPHGEA